MKSYKHYMPRLIVFLVLLGISPVAQAQFFLPGHQFQHQHGDSLYMRWEPRSFDEWKSSLTNGYNIEISIVENGTVSPISSDQLYASKKDDFEKAAVQVDTFLHQFYTGAKDLIYMEENMQKELANMLEEEDGKTQEENVGEAQLAFLQYAITYDFQLMKMAGLAHAIKLKNNSIYQIKIWTDGFPPFIFDSSEKNKNDFSLPELSGNFKNKQVELKWQTVESEKYLFGYFLEKSTDGKNFELVQRTPFINALDQFTPDNPQGIKTPIELKENYKKYWFRLRGMNYMGFKTLPGKAINGHGYVAVKMPPIITFADQTMDNQAHITWKTSPAEEHLITSFEIHRADSLKGEYLPILTDISTNIHEVKIPMDSTSNHYKVGLVPKDGEPIFSFPVFIMGQDTTPPLTPSGFTGTIDSTGAITLQWDKNTERDLWGYRIYKTEFINDEFSLRNNTPIKHNVWTDEANLTSHADEVHFMIAAADRRNNQSPFSEILTLVKPDIVPPIPPAFREVKYMEDLGSIKVEWDNSGSKDVVAHHLFRKNITEEEEQWTLLKTFEKPHGGLFYDSDIQNNHRYAYVVSAMDDAGLDSEGAKPFLVEVKNFRPAKIIESVEATVDKENKSAIINWAFTENTDREIEEVIVYKGKSEKDLAMFKIVEPYPASFEVESLEEDEYYLLKPILSSGARTKYSDLIKLEIE